MAIHKVLKKSQNFNWGTGRERVYAVGDKIQEKLAFDLCMVPF